MFLARAYLKLGRTLCLTVALIWCSCCSCLSDLDTTLLHAEVGGGTPHDFGGSLHLLQLRSQMISRSLEESSVESPPDVGMAKEAHADPAGATTSGAAGAPIGLADGEALTATFSFGSNSIAQLRGRLDEPKLVGYPAKVPGAALAFAGPNSGWSFDESHGGTATLIPMPHEEALGTVVFLTDSQLAALDKFEAVPTLYNRKEFHAQVLRHGTWDTVEAIAYVKVDSEEWYAPSEAYRCAVLYNIRGSFPEVTSLTLRDSSGAVKEHWGHPAFDNLSVPAILFEIGVRKEKPWVFPKDISAHVKKIE